MARACALFFFSLTCCVCSISLSVFNFFYRLCFIFNPDICAWPCIVVCFGWWAIVDFDETVNGTTLQRSLAVRCKYMRLSQAFDCATSSSRDISYAHHFLPKTWNIIVAGYCLK